MRIATLDQFVAGHESGVRVHPEHTGFAYSDGESNERRLLSILRKVSDLSTGSTELASCIEDWVTEYHFTGSRANLLRHIPFEPAGRVLELGAGCGSITRFLGESGATITAVEGSLDRAQCARERCRDLANVSVYCGNFQDIAFESQYDVVTLIGVMEYSPKFFEGDDPIGACLAIARKALRPGGILVLAIENQLGLKYFAGATEDHLGNHYAGIEGRYPPKGVVTFGRGALEKHLRRAGFDNIEFQYPFPDYKLPSAILFDQGLGLDDFLADEIVRHMEERDYSGKHRRQIHSALVWPQLAANGLVGELSNSFLVVATLQSAGAAGLSDRRCLAVAYATDRARPYQTVTSFLRSEDGKIRVAKRRLHAGDTVTESALKFTPTDDIYTLGRTLHARLYERLRDHDGQGFIAALREWLLFLARFKLREETLAWATPLRGEAFDCLPSNLVQGQDGLVFIDKEWQTNQPVHVGTMALRYLFNIAFSASSRDAFLACFGDEPLLAIRQVLTEIGVEPYAGATQEFSELSEAVRLQVYPHKPPLTKQYLLEIESGAKAKPAPVASQTPAIANLLRRIWRRVFG